MYAPEPFTTFELPAQLILLSRYQAADRALCSDMTLDRWIAAGQLPTVRLGQRVLVRMSALDALLDSKRHPPITRPAPAPAPHALRRMHTTRRETAHWLRVSVTTLDRWSAPDAVPPLALPTVVDGPRRKGRPIRYRAADVIDLIDAHSEPATIGPLAGRHA